MIIGLICACWKKPQNQVGKSEIEAINLVPLIK